MIIKHFYQIMPVLFAAAFLSCQPNGYDIKPVAGNAYYLSTSGNDNNNGSKSNPWKSIAHLNNSHLQNGDTVYFAGGQTFNGTILIDSNKYGKSGRPVVITFFGTAYLVSAQKMIAGTFISVTAKRKTTPAIPPI